MIPVIPPRMKSTMKPTTKSSGGSSRGAPRRSVTIHETSWIPLGTVMTMLAATKKFIPMTGRPVAYMWWTHSPKLTKPMATRATTCSRYPAMGRPESAGTMVDTTPSAGSSMM